MYATQSMIAKYFYWASTTNADRIIGVLPTHIRRTCLRRSTHLGLLKEICRGINFPSRHPTRDCSDGCPSLGVPSERHRLLSFFQTFGFGMVFITHVSDLRGMAGNRRSFRYRHKDQWPGLGRLGDLTADASWKEDFEDGTMDGWSPAAPKDPDYTGPTKLDNWTVESDVTIAGEHSLWLHSEGDRNAIVTDNRVIDMSADFELSFSWMSPDPSNRGVTLRLIDSETSDFSTNKYWGVGNGIGFGMGPDAISENGSPYEGNGGFSGESFSRPSLAADEVHTVRIDKQGKEATLYFDGEEMATSDVRTSGTYRLMLWSSGTWGSPSSIAFDEFRYVPGATKTTKETTTAPPPETTSEQISDYSFEEGSKVEINIGYQTVYVVYDIPEADQGQTAVTTTDYELVGINTAYDALISYIYSVDREYFSLSSYEKRLQDAIESRKRHRFDELLFHVEEQLTNLLEAYTLSAIGLSSLTLDTALDGFTDAMVWGADWESNPYKRRMTEMTAILQNGVWMNNLSRDAHSISTQFSELSGMLNVAFEGYKTYSDAKSLSGAWSSVLSGAASGSGSMSSQILLQSGVQQAASVGTGIFVGKLRDYTFNQVEDWFAMNAEISAVMHAYQSARIPLLRRMKTLIKKAKNNELSAIEAVEIDTIGFTLDRLRSLAFDFSGQLYGQMAQMESGGIWNLIQNADTMSKRHLTIADDSWDRARFTFVGMMGSTEDRRRKLLDNSINVEILGGEAK